MAAKHWTRSSFKASVIRFILHDLLDPHLHLVVPPPPPPALTPATGAMRVEFLRCRDVSPSQEDGGGWRGETKV